MQTVHCCVLREVLTGFGTSLWVEVNECLWELGPLGRHGDVANLGMTGILFFLFLIMWRCVSACVYVHMKCWYRQRPGVCDPLERELTWLVASHLMWMLRMELRSSGKAVSAPNHWAISPAQTLDRVKWKALDYCGSEIRERGGGTSPSAFSRGSALLRLQLVKRRPWPILFLGLLRSYI